MAHEHDFAAVYEQFYPQVVRFLRGMLSGKGDADDLAQEVFLRLHASGARENVRFWLFRVARNLALNELRRVTVRERLRHFIGSAIADAGPHERAVSGEARRAIAAELARLRPDHRAALLLREWEEMSYDEIAATLGVSVAKVKSDIFRARQALRSALEGGAA